MKTREQIESHIAWLITKIDHLAEERDNNPALGPVIRNEVKAISLQIETLKWVLN